MINIDIEIYQVLAVIAMLLSVIGAILNYASNKTNDLGNQIKYLQGVVITLLLITLLIIIFVIAYFSLKNVMMSVIAIIMVSFAIFKIQEFGLALKDSKD